MHYAINARSAPLYLVEGMHIITVEGVRNCTRGLHPMQESLAHSLGSQGGFCTPGYHVTTCISVVKSNTSYKRAN